MHEIYQVYYRLNMPRQREDIYGLGPEDRLRALGDNRDRAKVRVCSRALAILNLMTSKTKQKHANHQWRNMPTNVMIQGKFQARESYDTNSRRVKVTIQIPGSRKFQYSLLPK